MNRASTRPIPDRRRLDTGRLADATADSVSRTKQVQLRAQHQPPERGPRSVLGLHRANERKVRAPDQASLVRRHGVADVVRAIPRLWTVLENPARDQSVDQLLVRAERQRERRVPSRPRADAIRLSRESQTEPDHVRSEPELRSQGSAARRHDRNRKGRHDPAPQPEHDTAVVRLRARGPRQRAAHRIEMGRSHDRDLGFQSEFRAPARV
jgi:hypothetical protein